MIDIHSHLLPGIDDGAKTFEESLKILENLAEQGVTDLILTPHYIPETAYNSPREHNLALLNRLKSYINQRIYREAAKTQRALSAPSAEVELAKNFPNLYLGNELYIDERLPELLQTEKVSSLAGSKYILVELPMSGKFENYPEIFENLKQNGYQVILAHPERYSAFQKTPRLLKDLAASGILFQVNLGSILGQYGKKAYSTAKKLAKSDLIFCFGSDTHHLRASDDLVRARKKLEKYYNSEKLTDLLENNPRQILKSVLK